MAWTSASSGPAPLLKAELARRALAGFFLSGLLFSFPGAILPVWRHHVTQDFLTVGSYFLAMGLGILVSAGLAARVLPGRHPSLILSVSSGIACAAFLFLALAPPAPLAMWWRMAGIFAVGCGAGMLNTAVFHAISPFYRHDPAATVNLAGIFFGAGCVLTAVLAAGTFYVYTVGSILVLFAVIPGYFIGIYALSAYELAHEPPHPSWRQVLTDFKSPGAVLFTLLLFFQFGNEWAVAGWLPLFLIHRLGVSPESSLLMLAVYWLALLAGRMAVLAALPVLSHAKLLMGSALGAMLGCTILFFTNNRFGAVTGILFVGLGFAAVYPLVVEKIGIRFPYYHPGFFNGIFSLALTGGLLAPWSLGFFANTWGVRVVMLLPLVGSIVVFLLLLLIWAEANFLAARNPEDIGDRNQNSGSVAVRPPAV